MNKATCGDADLFPIYEGYIKLFRAHNAKRLASSAPAVMKRAWNAESVKFELFENMGLWRLRETVTLRSLCRTIT